MGVSKYRGTPIFGNTHIHYIPWESDGLGDILKPFFAVITPVTGF